MDLPIKFNNYEDCFLGVGQSHNNTVYVYDREKILSKIKAQLKCSHDDALRFFEKNINRDFGKRSPIFLCRVDFLDI